MAVFIALIAGAPSDPAQTPAPTGSLGSTFFDWDHFIPKPTGIGAVRAGVNTVTPTLEKFEFHITTLLPGRMSHPPHRHPQEEMILLKEGTLESSINGAKRRIGSGSLLFFASYDVHNVTNVGDKAATYYVINFFTGATQSVRNQAAAEWEPEGLLHSSVIEWDQLVAQPNATGTRRLLVDSPTLTFARLEIHASTLNPGSPPSKPHRHPWLELMIVKDGWLETTVDGVAHRSGPGSVIYIASNSLQSLRNPGPLPTTYFVFQVSSAETPRPLARLNLGREL